MKIFDTRFQPCGGFSLKWALRIMAILNVLMVLTGAGLLANDIFQLWEKWQIEKTQTIVYYYIRLVIWIAYTMHIVLSAPLDYFIYKVSKTENTNHLRICFFLILVNTTFSLLIYWFHTFLFGLHVPTLAIYNGYVIFEYYECAVIHFLIKEIEEEREFSSAKRALTEAELLEFEEGLPPPPLDIETKSLLDKVIYQRFKKEEYDIPPEHLKLDMTSILGKGDFGVCYKAKLEKGDGYERTVAVKMINPEDTDVVYFKALLTELKIMSCIETNENVVQFIGAITKDIKERKLLIVLEFCAFGNMVNYLRGSRGLYRNIVRNGGLLTSTPENHYDESPFNENEVVSTLDLIRWSYQIAGGMEFLESKKIIHGDLAARNTLLNSKKMVKISDFGLARQLYAYSVYVRKQNTPLPWRYIALESLTDMAFSSASDVWAYGVTLWELFTLAEVPYPGYDFSLMFVEELKHGLRLNMPPFAPHDIYQKLMLKCWEACPSNRPSFTEIRKFFSQQYEEIILKS